MFEAKVICGRCKHNTMLESSSKGTPFVEQCCPCYCLEYRETHLKSTTIPHKDRNRVINVMHNPGLSFQAFPFWLWLCVEPTNSSGPGENWLVQGNIKKAENCCISIKMSLALCESTITIMIYIYFQLSCFTLSDCKFTLESSNWRFGKHWSSLTIQVLHVMWYWYDHDLMLI